MQGISWKKISLCLLCSLLLGSASAFAEKVDGSRPDPAGRNHAFSEYLNVYKSRQLSSTYPIEIKRKGCSLLVMSGQPQLLPVYRDNGVFFGLFRLNKGTNWISGLPRGTYIINNSKFTFS